MAEEVKEHETVVFWKEKADPKMRDCGSADVPTLIFWVVATLAKLDKLDMVARLHEAVVAAQEEADKARSAPTKKDAWDVFYGPAIKAYSKALKVVAAIEADLKTDGNSAHCFAWWLHSRLTGEFQFLQIQLAVKK